jgi:DNA processing protein
VGARKATSYGLDVARELAAALALTELAVISGMALGIDSEAHRGALDSGGTTVAVLAGGSDVPYPASHAVLHRQISERGLVLSEMPPGVQPLKWMFPARNRLIAALAGMTVVVQAGARSGSLITARHAAELGRDVGAVPGEIRLPGSSGTNGLIADGAALVSDAQAVLDRLVHVSARAPRHVTGPPLPAMLQTTLAAVEQGCSTGDAISAHAGLSGKDAAIALTQLELHGYVQVGSAGGYARTSLRQPSPE